MLSFFEPAVLRMGKYVERFLRTRARIYPIMCTNGIVRAICRKNKTGGIAMLNGLADGVVIYFMAAAGVIGVIAKVINQITLNRLVKEAGNMPKSTHKLIKLVRSKYEHACMIHGSVDNIDAFAEKYIYEYRGCIFRIHTWRQLELLSVWFSGTFAAWGALYGYLNYGFTEAVYQYIALGIAEVLFLSVIIRMTDEPYKIGAVKMYMVDYLENICAFRLKKMKASDREFIDVIASEGAGKQFFQDMRENLEEAAGLKKASQGKQEAGSGRKAEEARGISKKPESRKNLAISIEECADSEDRESRSQEYAEADRPALKEETIRQILEEFLA